MVLNSSTTHHKEGHNLREVTFQTDILSFVDNVSVPLFDNIKLTNMDFHVSELQPCNQADVDTRILLHVDNHK